MSTITVKTIREGKPCGFCSTGHHSLCPGGILNGDRVTVVLCGCQDHQPRVRCLVCNYNGPDVDHNTWACVDQDACAARRAKAREKSLVALYGSSENGQPLRAVPAAEKAPKAPPKPKYGKCLCCGETTGGGLFRPGHDSKYLTRAVAAVKGLGADADHVITDMARDGVSEALIAKFRERVA